MAARSWSSSSWRGAAAAVSAGGGAGLILELGQHLRHPLKVLLERGHLRGELFEQPAIEEAPGRLVGGERAAEVDGDRVEKAIFQELLGSMAIEQIVQARRERLLSCQRIARAGRVLGLGDCGGAIADKVEGGHVGERAGLLLIGAAQIVDGVADGLLAGARERSAGGERLTRALPQAGHPFG